MSEQEFAAFEGRVWQAAAAKGMEGPEAVVAAYRPLVTKYATAGLAPEAAGELLVEQMLMALDHFNVLADALNLASASLTLTVQVLDGEDDPIAIGQGVSNQRAGIAVLADEMALIAPFAGIADGFDREETARERAEACAARDSFMAQIQAAAEAAGE